MLAYIIDTSIREVLPKIQGMIVWNFQVKKVKVSFSSVKSRFSFRKVGFSKSGESELVFQV